MSNSPYARGRILASLGENPPRVGTDLTDRSPDYAGDLLSYRNGEPSLPPLLTLALVAADHGECR